MSVRSFDSVSRLALAIGAAVLLWILAVNLHVARLTAEGATPHNPGVKPTPAQLDRRARTFLAAARDAPDVEPLLYLGAVYFVAERRRASIARSLQVARREPENLAAWRGVAVAAKGVAPGLRARAIARIRALNPFDPPIP